MEDLYQWCATEYECCWMVGQLEQGAEGTRHLQFTVSFKNSVYQRTLERAMFKNCHAEIRRGTPLEAEAYCTKDETAVLGGEYRFRFGERPDAKNGQGRRSDLKLLAQAVAAGDSHLELALKHTAGMIQYSSGVMKVQAILSQQKAMRYRAGLRVIVLNGPTGSGKTRRAWELAGGYDASKVYPLNKDKDLWWDGYQGQDVVIFDDFRDHWMPYDTLLRLLDKYPVRVPIKGSTYWFNSTTVIITCCKPPETWYPEEPCKAELYRRLSLVETLAAPDYQPEGGYVPPEPLFVPRRYGPNGTFRLEPE